MDAETTVWGLFLNAKETRKIEKGTVIFTEGDRGAEMYGIVDGEVELRGKGGLVRRLGAHSVFGEMALVDESPRSATAVATTDATLATIDKHRFLFLVQETPTFALDVMAVMAERLRNATLG